MSGEEPLSEEQWRKAGMSESLRGRSEEMTRSNTSYTWESEILF